MACKTACGKNRSQAHVAGKYGSNGTVCDFCLPRSKKMIMKASAGNTGRKVTGPENSCLVDFPEHPTSIMKNSLFMGEIKERTVEALAQSGISALSVKEIERKQ